MPTQVNLFLPPAAAGTYSQAHPYGPDSAGGFFPDLQIDIQGADRPKCPAIAVTSGIVRMIRDTATPGVVTLVLLPFIGGPAMDVRDALGSYVGFVYRNLDDTDTAQRMLQ